MDTGQQELRLTLRMTRAWRVWGVVRRECLAGGDITDLVTREVLLWATVTSPGPALTRVITAQVSITLCVSHHVYYYRVSQLVLASVLCLDTNLPFSSFLLPLILVHFRKDTHDTSCLI